MLEIALKVDTCPRRFGKCYWRRAKHWTFEVIRMHISDVTPARSICRISWVNFACIDFNLILTLCPLFVCKTASSFFIVIVFYLSSAKIFNLTISQSNSIIFVVSSYKIFEEFPCHLILWNFAHFSFQMLMCEKRIQTAELISGHLLVRKL